MYITALTFVVAFTKIRLVVLYFMEVREAILPLRLMFEIWIVLVCVCIIVAFNY